MPPVNVLIIHTDQHRWDCLGAYGNTEINTPNIDALARDGVTYSNAFCPLPVCTPSRYSLLTGQYVHQHLGWSNYCTIPAGLPTLPRELKKHGYSTAAVGKMHFTPTYLDIGFDTMLLSEQDGPGRFDDDYHRWLMEEGLCDINDIEDQRGEYRKDAEPSYWESFGAITSNLDEAHHSTTWIGDRSIDMINAWGDNGNLLMAGFIKPHHPFDPPAPWDTMYDPDALTIFPGYTDTCLPGDLEFHKGYFPNENLDEATLKKVMALYYATISQIDHQVGRIVEALKAKALYDQTMIVFTSDHGDYMGFHHMLLKSNLMYDPVMRIPLIVKYPDNAQAGCVVEGLNTNIDVAPTILTAAGIACPGTMKGIDLHAVTEGRDYVISENGRNSYMVRTHGDKLLYHSDPKFCRYFNLAEDPLEMTDLYNDPGYQHRISELKGLLRDWLAFDAPPFTHLDTNAPTISAANVPLAGDGHEQVSRDYFKEKMAQSRG